MEMVEFSKPRKTIFVASLCWLLVLTANLSLCNGDAVHAHLKRLNKPPLKSFQSPDGDIIDCVHISQQLAFDHPSLKNHTIQMKPSYIPEGISNEKEVQQTWHLNGTCPEETIPVRRTTREDVLRAISVGSFGTKQHKSIRPHDQAPALSGHEYAVAYVQGGKYYGAKATISLWAPAVMHRQEFSLSQLWLIGGPFDSNLNTIEAGWQVYPFLYGDYRTRLFIYWTSDNYNRTGCYNLFCSGFIQTNKKIAIGGSISPVSHYKGSQSDITIFVWKDIKSGNWWLQVGDNLVGYWPSNIFNRLNNYGTMVEWGGEIVDLASRGKHTTTNMGSGHFPNEGYGKASFFKNVQTVDGSNYLSSPNLIGFATPSKSCYDIKIGDVPIPKWGTYFFYGGPGRNSRCP